MINTPYNLLPESDHTPTLLKSSEWHRLEGISQFRGPPSLMGLGQERLGKNGSNQTSIITALVS